MSKNDNTIFWVIGIVLLFIVISNPQFLKQQEEGMIGLDPHYYKDGVEIFPEKGFFGFTIVTPPGGSYDQIAFDISATNTGGVPIIDIQIIDAFPLVFKNALPTTTQNLEVGDSKILWTSDLMNTEQFESVSPVNFWIEVSGRETFTDTTIFPDRAYSGDISFLPDQPTATQTLFSDLFSIVEFGGITYHNDVGRIRDVSGGGVYSSITSYSGSSGYINGIFIEGLTGLDFPCRIYIDGALFLQETAVSYGWDSGTPIVSYYNPIRFTNSFDIQCTRGRSSSFDVVYTISYITD